MANEKTLHTRIQLKYDTLANWTTKNTLLLQGEIAIATIDSANPANKLNPPVMFKVGPGNFNNLEWASALAADVYGWAKSAGLPVDATSISDGEYVTGLEWKNDKLYITKANLITDIANNGTSLKAATTKAVKDYVDSVAANIVAQGTVVAEGAKIDVAQEGNKYTVSHETIANPTETAGTGRKYLTGVTTDGYGHITGFTTASEVDQDLSNYKTKQGAVEETGAEDKTLKISQNANGEISVEEVDIKLTSIDQLSENIYEYIYGAGVANANTAAHADAATKVDHALTIGGKSFNGSADVSVSLTDLDVYSKGEIDTLTDGKLHTEENIKTIAATEINRLIGAADDEGGETIQNIANLVDYVEKNAGEIAGLVTDVGTANTNASNAVQTANNANTTAGEALGKAEEALEGAEGARASAAAAKTSEDNAKTSETNANNSAIAAADSASAAATSESNAAGSTHAAEQMAMAASASADAANAAKLAAIAAQEAAEASNTSATAIANEAKNTADAAKSASDTATENVSNLTEEVNALNKALEFILNGDTVILNCGGAE